MSNTFKNINQYVFSEHAAAFNALIETFKAFSIRYFLIGAQARDIHFYQKGIQPMRGTRDIDFAVMVADMEQYKALIESLKKRGFNSTADPFRLNWAAGKTVIDLLPFGEIEENYTVNFDERSIELSVIGYRELNDELQEYYLDEKQSLFIPVPPLHGIFLLKLLSWDDKKPDREKDLKDIQQILYNYWEFTDDEAYTEHLDLFDDNFTTEITAARILGRHLKKTLSKSEVLKKRIIQILEQQSSQLDPPGLMLQKFAGDKNRPIEEVKKLLESILKGIND